MEAHLATGRPTESVAPGLAELTQAELAASAGVTRQTIVAVEAGHYAPSVYLALRHRRAPAPASRRALFRNGSTIVADAQEGT